MIHIIRSENAELKIMARDVEDIFRLYRAMKTHESGVLYPFATFDLTALVAEEGHKLLNELRPPKDKNLNPVSSDDERITQARARLKLFDDTKGGETGLVRLLDEVSQKVSRWSQAHHRGPLRAWKRVLQPDLGTFWLDQRLVATTHTALPSVGMGAGDVASWTLNERNSVGPSLRAYSQHLGTRIGALAIALDESGIALTMARADPEPPPRPITFNDFKSKKFYAAVTNRLQPVDKQHIKPFLMAICQINNSAYLLSDLLGRDSNLLLRAQTLAAYHGGRTISRVNPRAMAPLRHDTSGNCPFKINKDVRDLCAHYGLRGAGRHVESSDDDPFGSAIEGLTGLSRTTFQDRVQSWLRNLSDTAGAPLGKDDFVRYRALFGNHT